MKKPVTAILSLFAGLVFLPMVNCSADMPEDFAARERMVERQIERRGVTDTRVLDAMRKVPRHLFVPESDRHLAYGDFPVPIGKGQTISQPYIVAFMTEALRLKPEDRVLEIGTGSGYQAAILAEVAAEVYTVEIIPELGKRAEELLKQLGYGNVHVRIGDGYQGWADNAPYDAVIVTCAPDAVPAALVDQLAEGGRMIIPVGRSGDVQELVLGVKKGGVFEKRDILAVRFVPMVKTRE